MILLKETKVAVLLLLITTSLTAQKNNIIVAEKDSIRIEIERLGDVINSEYDDYAPVITADGSVMYFTSRRPFTEKEIKQNRESNEHIFEAVFDEKDSVWLIAEPLEEPVNLPKKHNSNIAISNDGQRLLKYQDDGYGYGDIYETYLTGSSWSEPVSLGKAINSDEHESSASISPDGRIIYFVSNRKEGSQGGRDIWMSRLKKDGKWGEAENLGATINTKKNEEGVFIHPDGKTLYFSSEGHDGIGGYDIFKSTYEDGKWSAPENLDAPINSKKDDLFFVLAANGKKGYYATSRMDGVKDIYEIRFIPISKKSEDTGPDLTVFKGVISDSETGIPIGATIEVTDNEKNEIIATYTSNSETGKYLISLPTGKNYGINVNADGYLFSSHSFDLTDAAETGFKEVKKDIALDKIKVGSKVVLKNIFFDFNKATLRNESKAELNRLVRILDDNNTMKIEIGGHTDDKGSDAYNENLSKNRAESVVNYLINQGVDTSRLTFIGYGESTPIDTNETKEGRQENRRVEFEVISK
jgi:outer membrane protein OmpA-like peptidoglycan-associated protein